ncbi:ParB N-terminal domain-containing protein [archaeon]|nr:ParB N-terminal domain-containing protein [archaeon]
MSKPPAAYTINHEGLRLDIALVETEKLLIHEQIIPYRLNKLKASIERDGVQSAPILVDRRTHVVLDGMHRTTIMKELGCRFTCVCLLDYFDPSITIQRWCRMVPAPFNKKNAETILNELDLKHESFDLVESPEDDESLLLIFKDSGIKIITENDDLVEAFKKSYKLERKLQEWGYKIIHCTESEARENLTSGSFEATMYLPKLDKLKVLDVAQKKNVFTPKATRHRLPARPVAVNAPLSLLRDKEITVEEANRRLYDMLKDKKIKRFDPGTEWMGRTYDEALYVFSDS